MDSASVLMMPMVLCLVAGAIAWALNRKLRILSGFVAVAASGASLALAVKIFHAVNTPASTLPQTLRLTWDWLSIGGFQPKIWLNAGHFSALMLLAIAFFGFLVLVYCLYALRKHDEPGKVYGLLLWALAGAFAVVLAKNWLTFAAGWEMVTAAVYLLTSMGGARAKEGLIRTFVTLGFADLCIMAAIILILTTGPGIYSWWGGAWRPLDSFPSYAIYCLFLIGALAKAGAIPLHKWVPASSGHANGAELALLTGALDKFLGIYLLARVSLQMFQIDATMQVMLLLVGAVTILGAVFMAMVQHNLKKLLAYHAVSQVGYIILGLGTGVLVGIVGGLFHLLNNAIYKSCLFLGAGAVEDATGEDDLDRMGGLGRFMPVTFVTMLIAALSIAGMPPLNGFVSKWMIYQGAISSGTWLAPVLLAIAVFGSALTLASFVKVLSAIFFGRKPDDLKVATPGRGKFLMLGPMLVLAALCILFGVWYMLPLDALIAPTLAELHVADGGAIAPDSWPGLWQAGWATALIIAGIVLGLLLYALGKAFRVRTVPAFMAGEVVRDDRIRFRATGFYQTVEELPLIGTMMRWAQQGYFDIIRVSDDKDSLLTRIQFKLMPRCVMCALWAVVLLLLCLLTAGLRLPQS